MLSNFLMNVKKTIYRNIKTFSSYRIIKSSRQRNDSEADLNELGTLAFFIILGLILVAFEE